LKLKLIWLRTRSRNSSFCTLAVDVFGSGPNVTFLRFDTLATLDRSVIACGAAPSAWLHAHRAVCFGVFGFGQS
jgi:hypothetical protein